MKKVRKHQTRTFTFYYIPAPSIYLIPCLSLYLIGGRFFFVSKISISLEPLRPEAKLRLSESSSSVTLSAEAPIIGKEMSDSLRRGEVAILGVVRRSGFKFGVLPFSTSLVL